MSSYDLKILVLSGKGLSIFDMDFAKFSQIEQEKKKRVLVISVTNVPDFLEQRDREHWDLVVIHDQCFVDDQKVSSIDLLEEDLQKLGKRKVVWITEVIQNYFQVREEGGLAFHVSLNEKYIKDSMSDLVEYLRGIIAENVEHEMPEACLSEGG